MNGTGAVRKGGIKVDWIREIMSFMAITVPVFIALFHLFSGAFTGIDPFLQTAICVYSLGIGAILLYPLGGKSNKGSLTWHTATDVLSILFLVGCCIYVFLSIDGMQNRIGNPNAFDKLAGTITVILLLEACRRTIGLPMVGIILAFLLHTLFGKYFPGILYGPSFSFSRVIEMLFMTDLGVFGIVMRITTNYLILWYVLAAFLRVTGSGEALTNLAFATTGRYVGGPAKAAVVSSCFFGTISGSPISDVMATGSFTIPMMKKLGYKPDWAAGIEAAASTGSAFTPPIMGATAFILAEFLGIPYFKVCIAAIIPCLAYYTALFMQVHFQAVKLGLRGLQKHDVPSIRESFVHAVPTVIVIALILFLLSRGYGLAYCGFWSIMGLILVSFFKKTNRLSPASFLAALESGGRTSIFIGPALAVAGILVGLLRMTGMGFAMGNMLFDLSAGSTALALILAALTSLILGLGLPVAVVYITVYAVAIPTLIKLGISPLAAHLFCYIYGVIHSITPPYAPAAFAASGLSGASPMKTGLVTCKLGVAAYLTPFAFVMAPAMLGEGGILGMFRFGGFSIIGFSAIASGLVGQLIYPTRLVERIALITGGALALIPWISTELTGTMILTLTILLHTRRRG